MTEEKGEFPKEKVDLIVIGNQNSGKTSLVKCFSGDQSFTNCYNPTLGISLQRKDITINNRVVCVSIWDTAGQEKFLSITKNYFQRADGVLIIFDLTDRNSFEKATSFWINEIDEKSSEEMTTIIIGNKIDKEKERVVQYQEAKKVAGELKKPYFETSAKTGQNVKEAITYIVEECLKKISPDSQKLVGLNTVNNSRTSCFSNVKNIFTGLFKKQK